MVCVEVDVVVGCYVDWLMVLVVCLYVVDFGCIDEIGCCLFWIYVYVLLGFMFDVIEIVISVFEWFVFGFCDIVVVVCVVFVVWMVDYNVNYVGGDIMVGVNLIWCVIVGFILWLNFWCILIFKVYLCFVVILFGVGVYGMCGWYVV